MNPSDCPYTECGHKDIAPATKECPQCKQWLNTCSKCGTPNRSFANFCRSCGQPVPPNPDSWSGFRGSVQRIALNRFVIPHSPPNIKITQLAQFNFASPCRSLLFYDGYFIAVSGDGLIKVLALSRLEREPITIKTSGLIQIEPAIHQGTLYVGTVRKDDPEKGCISAYTLGDILSGSTKDEPRWEMNLKGKPLQGILPFDDRLYVHVLKNNHREIHVLEGIKGRKPSGPLCLYHGGRASMLVGDMATNRVFFLSEKEGQLFVNSFDHTNNSAPELVRKPVPDAPTDFIDYTPVAAIGAKLFAVFGEKKELCRIDAKNIYFDMKITERVRNFSLAGMNIQVVINSTGMFSTAENTQENVVQGESIVSGPVVFKYKAVLVGMKDGKIRFYKLDNLSVQNEFPVFNATDSVQILAAFKNLIAVGSSRGEIQLLEII